MLNNNELHLECTKPNDTCISLCTSLSEDVDSTACTGDKYSCNSNMKMSEIINYCKAFKRIKVVLSKETFDICNIQNKEIYEHQQIFDDFMHVKLIHIDVNQEIGKELCDYLENEQKLKCCMSIINCQSIIRHYKLQPTIRIRNGNTKDITFQQECDKIHSYFFHSTIGLKINNE
eukprot:374403_1